MHRHSLAVLAVAAATLHASAQPETQPDPQPDAAPLPSATINYAALHNAEFADIPESDLAWPVYARLQSLLAPHFRDIRTLQTTSPADPNWPDAAALLDKLPELLPVTTQATARPVLGWPWTDALPAGWVHTVRGPDASVEEPSPDPVLTDIVLPYVGTIRAAATCLRLQALRDAEAGNLDSAIDALSLIPPMARHLEETRVSVTCIGAINIQSAALIQGILQLTSLHGSALSPAQLNRLDTLLDSITHTKYSADIIADEQSLFDDAIDNIYNQTDELGDPQISFAGAGRLMRMSGSDIPPDLDPSSTIPEDNKQAAIQRFRTMTPSYDQTNESWLRAWDTTAAESSPPVWTWTDRPAYQMLREQSNAAAEQNSTLPHLLFVASFGRIAEYCELLRMQTDAARVAVAIQRYHNTHNAWPESLDQVTGDTLPQIPADWVDGQPLRYTLKDNSPVLYSLGPDADDDQGTPLPQGLGERYLYPAQREANADAIPSGDWVLWP